MKKIGQVICAFGVFFVSTTYAETSTFTSFKLSQLVPMGGCTIFTCCGPNCP